MACDLQGTINNTTKVKLSTKIYKISAHPDICEEDFIVGFCGNSSLGLDIADYFQRPDVYKTPPKVRNVGALILTESGRIYTFENPTQWTELVEDYMAIGSGDMVALGALHQGASPEEAIVAASKIDPFTGCGVKSLSF